MKRHLVAALAVVVAMAALTAAALAASSPAVATGSATHISNSGAVLNGTVNPNGASTSDQFEYGLTTGYGLATPLRSVGSGTTSVSVSGTIGSLIPGTVYHYRVLALNRFGGTTGADRTFKTTGHPPAGVVTGPAALIGKSTVTLTGTVNPEGQATTWVFEYGLNGAYGVQTFAQTLPAVNTPITVSAQLAGLEPGTFFHYSLVAFHGGTVVSRGADVTFLTEPFTRPTPRLRAKTTPHRSRTKPYLFTTSLSVLGPGAIPASYACTGSAAIRYFNGQHLVAYTLAPVQPDCTASAQVGFAHKIGGGSTPLRVTIRFSGNGYLSPIKAHPESVVLG